MNNESEMNFISGVVNAVDEELTSHTVETAEEASPAVEAGGDEQPIAGKAEAKTLSTNVAEPDAADSVEGKPGEDAGKLFGGDIVEHIIDRVVERMTAGAKPAESGNSETTQRRSTPNFLSDIRPDFWDRL